MNNPLFAEIPEDLASIENDALQALIEDYSETIADVTSNPAEFVSPELSAADLMTATKAAIEQLKALKAEQASRVALEPAELTDEERAEFEALSAEPETEEPAEEEPEVEEEAAVVAAAPIRGRLPKPSGAHAQAPPAPVVSPVVPLVAAGGARDAVPGTRFNSELELAEAMVRRHETFGIGGPDVSERYAIARADWSDQYGSDRSLLGNDQIGNFGLISKVIEPAKIKQAMRERIQKMDSTMVASASGDDNDVLVASGGLCAPVTPYYNLQYISVPIRPVMGSLPSFQADRGGLRYARPAALSAVSTGIGLITEAEDAAGGTSATKTCQVIACPQFQETDVDTIYHCLQFGNLGARAFPELVAQWNNLVLAAHARLAESNLLTLIDAASTQVTAGSLGLGASATLFSQILAAANGLRNRNRMDPNAVLRLMIPWWGVDLIISDVIRTQFERFDTDQAKVTALLRSFNIEPTFYIDGANGRGQVFGTQSAGALLPFPPDIVWYLFPEGSFIYLDSGVLELGIVRDSVLNQTNDFQLFGESFESVAFVGVEALAVETNVCDSGTVSLPTAVNCPISYASGSF